MELTTDKRENDSEDVKKRKGGALLYFKEYCDFSGIHGFRHLTEERKLCERICWITALSVSIVLSGVMMYQIIDKYLYNPVITLSTQEEHIGNIPFPAVTICPRNKISQGYFNVTDAAKRYLYNNGFSGEIEKRYIMASSICFFRYKDVSGNYRNITADDLYSFMNESVPNIFSEVCIYRRLRYTCNSIFTPILTEEGVCYSFNIMDKTDIFRDDVFSFPGYHSSLPKAQWNIEDGYLDSEKSFYPLRSFQPGSYDGIFITLKTNISDIEYDCSGEENGYKVAVHLPSNIPDMSESYFSVPLKQRVTVQIIPNLIKTSSGVKAFRLSRRDCYFEAERSLKYFKRYTLENCNLECKTDITLRECGCVGFFMPRHKDTPVCMDDICSSAVVVKLSANLTYIKENQIYCDCLPTCADLNYNLEISQNTIEAIPQDERRETYETGYEYSVLELYYKRSRIESKERIILYGFSDFVSNFGGLLALFTGFSMLSLIEIVYFLTLRIWGNIKIYRNWIGQNNNIRN